LSEKITVSYFAKAKREGRPVTMLTAYDFPMGKLVDAAGIDSILVGDSLGNVVLGYGSTIPVTMDDMVHHVKAVTRGVQRALVVGDMPFLSYHLSREESVRNAGKLLQEGGAQAVKLEGGREVADVIKAMVMAGIPVVGHLGLTPQSILTLGGFKVQGKDEAAARKLLDDALAVQEAGAFAVVLELVPTPLAKLVTEKLDITTIGIGAGPHCDGQVLVTHDMLGFYGGKSPRFAKQYVNLNDQIMEGLKAYKEEVESRSFPGPEHGSSMPEEVIEKLK
jgi:3-methyl-2-oxobutanoate hydroxymethyltransferase